MQPRTYLGRCFRRFGLTLEQRIEYLSRAIGNAKSTSSDGRRFGTEGEFLSDLEDKLDVATVQMELLVRASREVPEEDRNILLPLREQLLSISEVRGSLSAPKLLQLITVPPAVPRLCGSTQPARYEASYTSHVGTSGFGSRHNHLDRHLR